MCPGAQDPRLVLPAAGACCLDPPQVPRPTRLRLFLLTAYRISLRKDAGHDWEEPLCFSANIRYFAYIQGCTPPGIPRLVCYIRTTSCLLVHVVLIRGLPWYSFIYWPVGTDARVIGMHGERARHFPPLYAPLPSGSSAPHLGSAIRHESCAHPRRCQLFA